MPIVDNAGTDIYYEVEGKGPPLVLHHGRLGSGEFWFDAGYVDALADTRTLVILDARGHGRSAKPASPDAYRPEDMAGDVIAVLDDLSIDKADFFGYSMGGRIGFMTVAHFDDRLHSLVAGGAGPYGPATSAEAELSLANSLGNGIEAYVAGMEKMLKATIPDDRRELLLANDAAALAALATATSSWPSVVDRVANVGVPIQLFGGTADPIWTLISQANGQLPTSELHQFDDLGHGEDLRTPKIVLPVLLDFLNRHGLTTA